MESSISGDINTEANEVCLLFPESNGDFLTSLCIPVSVQRHPYAWSPST